MKEIRVLPLFYLTLCLSSGVHSQVTAIFSNYLILNLFAENIGTVYTGVF